MTKKRVIPRFKVQRRLMTELPGLGKAGAMERKPYPPGEHGQKRIKYSEYRLQLEEKQKVRLHYQVQEKQLCRLVKTAKRSEEAWLDRLVGFLELRLHNVLFRGGFAPSQRAAAQMISHCQVLVNGRVVNIRSQQLRLGDIVTLTSKGMSNQIFLQASQSPRLPLPDWLEVSKHGGKAEICVKDMPGLKDIPFQFEPGLVTSYYSKF